MSSRKVYFRRKDLSSLNKRNELPSPNPHRNRYVLKTLEKRKVTVCIMARELYHATSIGNLSPSKRLF